MVRGDYAEALAWAVRSLALNTTFDPTYWMLIAGNALAHGMPAHKFLFTERVVAGSQPSYKAIKLPSDFAPPAGIEVVPTPRAEALVAYLLSLKDTYDYPTERGLNEPAAQPKEGGH